MADKYIEDKDNEVPVETNFAGSGGTVDFNTLKSGGFIKQRQKDKFTVRLRCPGGRVPLPQLEKIVAVAKQYGGEYVHLSFRQSIELPYVDYRDFNAVSDKLAEADQSIASCGARVRVPTGCAGCEYNPNGLTDTQKMITEVDEKFFGRELPHKFKISFSGCPIDCARTNENDLGFQGAVKPRWEEAACIGCRICGKACREGAIENDAETGKPVYYPGKCLFCGDCIRACPTDSWQEEKKGWIVRVGGRHGRHPVAGRIIARFARDEDIAAFIDTVTNWFAEHGAPYGRTRIGVLLQQPEEWNSFVTTLKEKFGDAIPDSPLPPAPNEIH